MDRYCAICEKKVQTAFILVEHGNRYSHGACGHNTLMVDEKVDATTLIMNIKDTHNSEYGKHGRK